MERAQFCFSCFVDYAVVLDGGLPTHTTDKTNRFHPHHLIPTPRSFVRLSAPTTRMSSVRVALHAQKILLMAVKDTGFHDLCTGETSLKGNLPDNKVFLGFGFRIGETTMRHRRAGIGQITKFLFGFIAGFFATLIFHQLVLAVLWGVGLAPFGPYSMAPTQPFGIPAVLSLSFWGGVWGILFAWIEDRFPISVAYWAVAFLFGAIFPSLVALLVVLPLKGRPTGGGWHLPLLVTAFLVNGAWGVGTGLILKALSRGLNFLRGSY